MRRLPDIRFSRSALALIAIVSGLATFVILHGTGGRSPVQLAALAALRDKPHATPATTTSAATTPAISQPSSGSSGGGSGSGSGSGGFAASGGGGSGGGGGFGGGSVVAPAAVAPRCPAPRRSSATSDDHADSDIDDLDHLRAPRVPRRRSPTVPKLGHVFEIMLSAPSYTAAFGHTSTLTALHSLDPQGDAAERLQDPRRRRARRRAGGGERAGAQPRHEARLHLLRRLPDRGGGQQGGHRRRGRDASIPTPR